MVWKAMAIEIDWIEPPVCFAAVISILRALCRMHAIPFSSPASFGITCAMPMHMLNYARRTQMR